MLCVEDYLDALEWAERLGGLPALIARADANATAVDDWVERTAWIDHLAVDPATRSNTSVCLEIAEGACRSDKDAQAAFVKKHGGPAGREGAAYDVAAYRDAPPGPAHLVRRHRRDGRPGRAVPLARLGLRGEEGGSERAA